eukprot:s6676_g2.t1
MGKEEADELLDMDETSSDEDKAEEMDLPLYVRHPKTVNIVALLVYMALGMSVMSFYENWSFVTSFYVIVQIVTTVGYGDIAPTASGELFLTFYVLLGTVLVASILNGLIESFLEASEDRLGESLIAMRTNIARSVSQDDLGCRCSWSRSVKDLASATMVYLFFLVVWAAFFTIYEGCSCSYGASRIDGCEEGDQCLATGGAHLSIRQSFYMGVITFSTVGFGDFSPKSRLGRMFGSVWMILGIIAFGTMVGHEPQQQDKSPLQVSTILNDWRRFHKRRVLVSRDTFNKMDRDGSGKVRRHEFLRYMLVRQGLVKAEALENIDALFEDLDQLLGCVALLPFSGLAVGGERSLPAVDFTLPPDVF